MDPTDWIFSTVIFVGMVATLFIILPSLLPQKPDVAMESELKQLMDTVTEDIEVKALILKSDCNAEIYADCNRYFPVMLDANVDLNYLLSKPFAMDLNKIYTILAPQEFANVFILEPGTLAPQYNLANLVLSASTTDDIIRVHNNFLDANITDTNTVISFVDSNTDLIIKYPTMQLQLLRNSKELVIVGNKSESFYLLFFPNTSEFWLDVPDDINVTIVPSAKNWRIGSSIGVTSADAWWDYLAGDDEWWHYRIPITVNSLDCSRTNEVVQTTIDFASVKQKLSVTATIDPNSFRMIEYVNGEPIDYDTDTNGIDPIPYSVDFNSDTEQAVVTWQLTGDTDANEVRTFYLYFDFYPYEKSAPSYADLTYTELQCPVLITVGDAQDTSTTQYVFISGEAYIFNPNTFFISVLNDVQRSWLNAQISYRLPIAFSAGDYNRQDVNVSLDINFAQEFASVNCDGCDLNVASVYLVEVTDLDTGTVKETLTKGTDWDMSYNTSTKVADLWFVVKGITPAGSKRYYYLYYDNLES